MNSPSFETREDSSGAPDGMSERAVSFEPLAVTEACS